MELRPASYFVLASLLDGPLHGYAISTRAAELTPETIRAVEPELAAMSDAIAAMEREGVKA
jgi:PadR family transcriptional regulator PadR